MLILCSDGAVILYFPMDYNLRSHVTRRDRIFYDWRFKIAHDVTFNSTFKFISSFPKNSISLIYTDWTVNVIYRIFEKTLYPDIEL